MRGVAKDPSNDKRRKISAPVQAAPAYPVCVQIMYKDAEDLIAIEGWKVVQDARFLKIIASATEAYWIALDSVCWMRVVGVPTMRDETVPEPSQPLPRPSAPMEYSVRAEAQRIRDEKVATARAMRAEVKGGGEVPASVIVNADGTTETVLARLD